MFPLILLITFGKNNILGANKSKIQQANIIGISGLSLMQIYQNIQNIRAS